MNTKERRKRLKTNDVRLSDLPFRLLDAAHAYACAEVEGCQLGIAPEERPVWVAMANTIAREIRRRGRRVKYQLPEPKGDK